MTVSYAPRSAVRTLRAEPGERRVDDVGVHTANVFVAEPEPVHDAGPEVLDEHVRLGGQTPHDVDALRRLDVDRDRPLPAVARRETASSCRSPTRRPSAAMSPMPGRSTLTTVAPWSASSAAAYGPGQRDRQVEDRTPSMRSVAARAGARRSLMRRTPRACAGRPSGPLYARPQRGGTANSGATTAARAASHAFISASSAA